MNKCILKRISAFKEDKCILKRISELKSSQKLFSMKSETNDGLSNCSIFSDRPTETELASNKPVLHEIEHLKCKLTDKELDSLRVVLNRHADVLPKYKAYRGCCDFVEKEEVRYLIGKGLSQ